MILFDYMKQIADDNYDLFYNQSYATAGHNGPHGHEDTPARNTSHYLIIYCYLYKKTHDEKYLKISRKFADYLMALQKKSKSGAVHCMLSDKFDHLNGLIGQGWVIEALLYYYEFSNDERCLQTAKSIFFSQSYNWKEHLWHRIELDGRDIGIDPTYNHHVWFAACAYKLNNYCNDNTVHKIITDFLTHGAERDFKIYDDGLLCHHVAINSPILYKTKCKRIIKQFFSPIKFLNPQKFDYKFIEYAYHIFSLYGFCILKEKYGYMPLFSSSKYIKAVDYAKDICNILKNNGIYDALNKNRKFNPYSFSYNSFAFEYPYVAKQCEFKDVDLNYLCEVQNRLMYDEQTKMFTRNQPDIDTWNARIYELIRYYEWD